MAMLVFWLAGPVLANPFSDLKPGHWAYDAVKRLVDKGIMTGLPDNSFRGQKNVTRYEVAVCLSRTLEQVGEMAPADRTEVDRLVEEFLDELAMLGVRVAVMEDEIQSVSDNLTLLKQQERSDTKTSGRIKISGDSWLHMDNLKYENDTTDDNINTYYQIGLNVRASVDDDIDTFVRIVNEELVGNELGEDIQGSTVDIDLAYVNMMNFFDVGDIRIGRQFVKVGHSIVLDNKLDAITVSRMIEALDLTVLFADMDDAVTGGTHDSGFALKGLDMKFSIGDHGAEFYYFINSTPTLNPSNYGFTLDGVLIDKVWYLLEYGQSDPDNNTVEGSFWLSGIGWDFTDKIDIEILYGKGDNEFTNVAGNVYHWHRYKDMFGNMALGTLPEGRSFATGSLTGIKDVFFLFEVELSEKTSGTVIHETVSANKSNVEGYQRITIGIDNHYAPNTAIGLRYDTVEFDNNNYAQNSGGWNRIRVEMRAKF